MNENDNRQPVGRIARAGLVGNGGPDLGPLIVPPKPTLIVKLNKTDFEVVGSDDVILNGCRRRGINQQTFLLSVAAFSFADEIGRYWR